MTDQLLATYERDAWLDWRRGGVGGSDVAKAAAGIYGGAYGVVAEKLGISARDIDPDNADRGHRWEPAIADGVRSHTGLAVGYQQAWFEHPVNRRHRVTPDGVLLPDGRTDIAAAVAGLEVKTRQMFAPWPWLYWTAQTNWGMYVLGLPRWLLAVATIDNEFDPATGALNEVVADVRYRWIYADPLLQEQLLDIAGQLLEHVDAGTLPEPTEGDALADVKAVNRIADPTETDVDLDDLAELLERYEDLRDARKQAELELSEAEARIRHRMGKATEAHTTDGRWRVRVGAPVFKFTDQSEAAFIDEHGADHPELLTLVLDRQAAKDELPDEYDDHRIPTTDRRLTIKRLQEDHE